MEPIIVASIIVSVALAAALLLAAAVVASAIRRSAATSSPAALATPDDALGAALRRLERRLSRIEKAARRRRNTADEPLPVDDARPTVAGGTQPFDALAAPTMSRTRCERGQRWADEIRRLAERGRNPIEIAQLVDADVGEVELVLRLGDDRGSDDSRDRPDIARRSA